MAKARSFWYLGHVIWLFLCGVPWKFDTVIGLALVSACPLRVATHLNSSPKRIYNAHKNYSINMAVSVLSLRGFCQWHPRVAPFLAGIAHMNKTQFVQYSFISAIIWGAGLPWLGFGVGHLMPPEACINSLPPDFIDYPDHPFGPAFQQKTQAWAVYRGCPQKSLNSVLDRGKASRYKIIIPIHHYSSS